LAASDKTGAAAIFLGFVYGRELNYFNPCSFFSVSMISVEFGYRRTNLTISIDIIIPLAYNYLHHDL